MFPRTFPLLLCLLLFTFADGNALPGALPAGNSYSSARQPNDEQPATARGVEIVQNGGYPELHVDGQPFFPHSAAFFYYRIPRDLWEKSLDRHLELGINTIDLYIPWNWHEPAEGQFDFDGQTNPRRNLRELLRLIAAKGFKLIARPGPVILNEWRHGGYPDWLLSRSEYNMPLLDRLEGRYPPLSNLNARDAEAAAKGWLENRTHMAFARKWMQAVARELAPYGASQIVNVSRPGLRREEREKVDVPGPLLFVQLDDDLALGRYNTVGPNFWRYMEELRAMLHAGGLNQPVYINPIDMRVPAAASGFPQPIGVMGQWYLEPSAPDAAVPASQKPSERKITALDASILEFYTETLKTQPAFPPFVIEYQAAWYNPGDDVRPEESSIWNTLLSSRLLLAHGLHGINYFPAQDSITPAGYSTPWTNRYYRWDAALDPAGNRQPRARAVVRNGFIAEMWGRFLASSHKRADFGLVYPMGSIAPELLGREEIRRVSESAMRIARVARLANLNIEYVDAEHQPLEHLMRHAVLVLPVIQGEGSPLALSEKTQAALLEYARRGGVLILLAGRPAGRLFDQVFSQPPVAEGAAVFPPGQGEPVFRSQWNLGEGKILLSTKDFYSWVRLPETMQATRNRFEAPWSLEAVRQIVQVAGVNPVVVLGAEKSGQADDVVVTQLISNAGTLPLGRRRGGRGLLAVTNLDHDEPFEGTLDVLAPGSSARGRAERVSVPVNVPPHESLFLPLNMPLCDVLKPNEVCKDEVVMAGAELLLAERDNKTLELTFYTPAKANVILKLAQSPSKVSIEDYNINFRWSAETSRAEFEITRGLSPAFIRRVKIQLPYVPKVQEKPDPPRRKKIDYDLTFLDTLRMPLADSFALASNTPVVLLSNEMEGRLLLEAENRDAQPLDLEFELDGPVRGSGWIGLDGKDTRQLAIRLRPKRDDNSALRQDETGLFSGNFQSKAGREIRQWKAYFLRLPKEGSVGYQHDFDRDGNPEWMLESPLLRLILSPASGGAALGLMDTVEGSTLLTNVGGLQDHFAYTPNPPNTRPARARGRYGMFNRGYKAEWLTLDGGPAIRMSYFAPDVYPAGAEIAKIIGFKEADSVLTVYEVALGPGNSNAANEPAEPQAFVSVSSVPLITTRDETTQICWQAAVASQAASQSEEKAAKPMHCEPLVPRGPAVKPEGVHEIEVRQPDRPGLVFVSETGSFSIEPRLYSALVKIQFPPLDRSGKAMMGKVLLRRLPFERPQ